jgi:sec-independent protein translocase protein TatB
MFDISFFEMLVIAIVALIVIGPQRLPAVARTLGHLFGRMQRYVNDVKADISREMELDELKKLQSSMEDTARSMRDSLDKEVSETTGELNKVAQSAQVEPDPFVEPAAQPASQPAPEAPQGELPLEAKLPAQKPDSVKA